MPGVRECCDSIHPQPHDAKCDTLKHFHAYGSGACPNAQCVEATGAPAIASESFYKIRRSDGLFSNGGMWPSFSKRGKVWRNINAVRSHITQVVKRNRTQDYQSCDLIEYKTTPVIRATLEAEIIDVGLRKQQKEQARLTREEKAKRAAEIKLLKELKVKHPNV